MMVIKIGYKVIIISPIVPGKTSEEYYHDADTRITTRLCKNKANQEGKKKKRRKRMKCIKKNQRTG